MSSLVQKYSFEFYVISKIRKNDLLTFKGREVDLQNKNSYFSWIQQMWDRGIWKYDREDTVRNLKKLGEGSGELCRLLFRSCCLEKHRVETEGSNDIVHLELMSSDIHLMSQMCKAMRASFTGMDSLIEHYHLEKDLKTEMALRQFVDDVKGTIQWCEPEIEALSQFVRKYDTKKMTSVGRGQIRRAPYDTTAESETFGGPNETSGSSISSSLRRKSLPKDVPRRSRSLHSSSSSSSSSSSLGAAQKSDRRLHPVGSPHSVQSTPPSFSSSSQKFATPSSSFECSSVNSTASSFAGLGFQDVDDDASTKLEEKGEAGKEVGEDDMGENYNDDSFESDTELQKSFEFDEEKTDSTGDGAQKSKEEAKNNLLDDIFDN